MATYAHARPALTVDCVVLGYDDAGLKVALIRRGLAPYLGRWALPGGFVHVDESVDDAARRELAEEAGLSRVWLEQLYTFGAVGRDPRERVVTVAYWALVRLADHRVQAATDASEAAWHALDELPRLAFDHAAIVAAARERLRSKVRWQPIGFELLPRKFTLGQLQRLYEMALGRALDKRNFRKKVLALGILDELDEHERNVAHRAARLYRFDETAYRQRLRDGFSFEL
ncbi:MAG TPA: NUDIX domain-containing protein [Planctomycetota bacterium]|nr:NUDIX domain-containing protein [Planctomycetota bacterium]